MFLEDASKAEFSRNRNPLYSPDHPPIQLPSYIVEGDLDIKISEESSLKPSHTPGMSQSHTGMTESQGKVILFPHTNGFQEWEHQNGTDTQSTGIEVQEQAHRSGNDVLHTDSDSDHGSATSQRIQSEVSFHNQP